MSYRQQVFNRLITDFLKYSGGEAYHDECHEGEPEAEHEEVALVILLIKIVGCISCAGTATAHKLDDDIGYKATNQANA